MPVFLTKIKLSILNFFILPKNVCEIVNFSKTLKSRHFLLDVSDLSFLACF